MIKILNIKVSGYRLFKKDFEINLLTKARVSDEDLEESVIALAPKLNSNNVMAFTGSNASGKTSLLELIYKCYRLLYTGNWLCFDGADFKDSQISLQLYFFGRNGDNDNIYRYKCSLIRPSDDSFKNDVGARISAKASIKDEICEICKYKPIYGNKIFNLPFEPSSFKKDLSDTAIFGASFNDGPEKSPVVYLPTSLRREDLFSLAFNNSNKKIPEDYLVTSLRLLDDSLEDIHETSANNGLYFFKRVGQDGENLTIDEIIERISEGTIRGALLYKLVFLSLVLGRVLIVDEIERSFHKNLVDNIILLYNDKTINKHGAQLIFSTHYSEILDSLSRRDSVFVMHHNEDGIDVKNLYEYKKIRCEISKSRQFNTNAFNTLLNYDLLQELKKDLKKQDTNSQY